MITQEVNQIIDNLKGRRSYEEKKAKKLGFTSLYDYFEDKLKKQRLASEYDKVLAEKTSIKKEIQKKNKSSKAKCKCC
tara:strand:+ start:771 stop:1004 length:234 start_codon:yes stop_codon:yes gene_type:complete